MTLRVNGEAFILWRAVDSEGHELDIFLQKRRDKKSAIRLFGTMQPNKLFPPKGH